MRPCRRMAALALVFLLAAAPAAAAELPNGPRIALHLFGVEGPRTKTEEGYDAIIASVGPAGEDPAVLITQPSGGRPSWSADGRILALSGTNGSGRPMVAIDDQGSGRLRFYPRAELDGGDPVVSPDGRRVAFARTELVKVLPGRENYLVKSAIWLLDVRRGTVRRATPWRLGTHLTPSSFSPDGSKLATTVFSRRGLDAVAVDLRSGRFSLLARNALEPTYAPDGRRFAFVRYLNWRQSGIDGRRPARDELRVGEVGRVSGARLLLRPRGFLSSPSWDPSGSRLVFVHSRAEEIGDRSPRDGNALMAVNADGSCLTKVFSDPELTVLGAAWQPGPGREAGPLPC